MMIIAELEVERERVIGEEIEIVPVTVIGRFEEFGSANPNERGWHLDGWDVIDPPVFVLTASEREYAEEKLYREMEGAK